MNLDRFGFKAISKSTGAWAFAYLETSFFGCFGVRWNLSETEEYPDCHIEPETLCQCTGIRDSDGRLIYENDILSVEKPGEEPEKATVIFSESDNNMIVKMRGVKFYWLSRFVWRVRWDNWKIKVIGNKFDKEVENG